MAILPTTCPHCFKENVAFYSVADFPPSAGEDRPCLVFMVCGNCRGGLVVEAMHHGSLHEKQWNLLDSGCELLRTYPAVPALKIPERLPDNISRFYLQAATNLRGRNWDASGAMCRKALDIATRDISFNSSGTLRERIDRLAAEHQITPALQEWAHAIRLDGNNAVHEEMFDGPSATDLLSFTELFLMYVFTLPGMLEERKRRAAK